MLLARKIKDQHRSSAVRCVHSPASNPTKKYQKHDGETVFTILHLIFDDIKLEIVLVSEISLKIINIFYPVKTFLTPLLWTDMMNMKMRDNLLEREKCAIYYEEMRPDTYRRPEMQPEYLKNILNPSNLNLILIFQQLHFIIVSLLQVCTFLDHL